MALILIAMRSLHGGNYALEYKEIYLLIPPLVLMNGGENHWVACRIIQKDLPHPSQSDSPGLADW